MNLFISILYSGMGASDVNDCNCGIENLNAYHNNFEGANEALE